MFIKNTVDLTLTVFTFMQKNSDIGKVKRRRIEDKNETVHSTIFHSDGLSTL